MPLPLSMASVRALARDYGLSLDMQELILTLDDHVTEMLQKEHGRKKKGGKG